jgi:hypothetical protein
MKRFGLLLLEIECPKYREKLSIDSTIEVDEEQLVHKLDCLLANGSISHQLGVSKTWAAVLEDSLYWEGGNCVDASEILRLIFDPLHQELQEIHWRFFTHGLLPVEQLRSSPRDKDGTSRSGVQMAHADLTPRSHGAQLYDDLNGEHLE